MKSEEEITRSHQDSPKPSIQDIASSSSSSSLLPRILSGSIGSIVTALAVTPLEVVKIRQQLSTSTTTTTTTSTTTTPLHPSHKIIQPCPRGCTVILNNGLMECLVPKSSLCYNAFALTTKEGSYYSRSFNSAQQTFLPRSNGGTFHTLLSILHYEGVSGLYAGLRPTLLMSVPNTVLYFTVYDEISSVLLRYHHYYSGHSCRYVPSAESRNAAVTTNQECNIDETRRKDTSSQPYIAFIAGSTARLLASLSTAPLELIRTRQAGLVTNDISQKQPSMIQEFRHLLRNNGLSSLYVGLSPTLWRDVPFSAIYWMCLERFKSELHHSDSILGPYWSGKQYSENGWKLPPRVEALHAFLSGAAAGCIAAALTTPFDVVKTRRQMIVQDGGTGWKECRTSSAGGYGRLSNNLGVLQHMRQIVQEEGVAGLWKGNTTRMVKVAPACAIMISVYEFGKRAFGEVM